MRKWWQIFRRHEWCEHWVREEIYNGIYEWMTPKWDGPTRGIASEEWNYCHFCGEPKPHHGEEGGKP